MQAKLDPNLHIKNSTLEDNHKLILLPIINNIYCILILEYKELGHKFPFFKK